MAFEEEQFANKNIDLIKNIMYIEKNDKKTFNTMKSCIKNLYNRVENDKIKSQIKKLIDKKENEKLLNSFIKDTFCYRDIESISDLLNIDSIKASAKLYHNSFNIEEIKILVLRYYNSFVYFLEDNGIDLEY